MLHDSIVRTIRTLVPIVIGYAISKWGLDISGYEAELTGGAITLYYLLVRLLETKVNYRFGILLGVPATSTKPWTAPSYL